MGTSKRYSEEVGERAVRMVAEHLHEHSSQWAAIVSMANERDLVQFIGMFRRGGARPSREVMVTFIDTQRCVVYGVEPICVECRSLR